MRFTEGSYESLNLLTSSIWLCCEDEGYWSHVTDDSLWRFWCVCAAFAFSSQSSQSPPLQLSCFSLSFLSPRVSAVFMKVNFRPSKEVNQVNILNGEVCLVLAMFQSLALQLLTDLHYFLIHFTKTSKPTTAYGLNTSATEYFSSDHTAESTVTVL